MYLLAARFDEPTMCSYRDLAEIRSVQAQTKKGLSQNFEKSTIFTFFDKSEKQHDVAQLHFMARTRTCLRMDRQAETTTAITPPAKMTVG